MVPKYSLNVIHLFHLIMVVNNGPAIVSAWIGGFELIPRTNIKQICNKYNICKYIGCHEIPSLTVNIDLASIPELRVLTREGVASCKWTVKLGLRLLILALDTFMNTIFLQYCMMLYHFSEKDTPRLCPPRPCPPCPCTAWETCIGDSGRCCVA